MALTDAKDIKKEEVKILKNKFDIIEVFENSAYILVNGQVMVIDKKVKDKQKKVELEYEVIDGEYIFK